MNVPSCLEQHNWDAPWNCYTKKIYQITERLGQPTPLALKARRIAALAVLLFAGLLIALPMYLLSKCARKLPNFIDFYTPKPKGDGKVTISLTDETLGPEESVELLNGPNEINTLIAHFCSKPKEETLSSFKELLKKNGNIDQLILRCIYFFGPFEIDFVPILKLCSAVRSLSLEHLDCNLLGPENFELIIDMINRELPRLTTLLLRIETTARTNMFNLMANLVSTNTTLTNLTFDVRTTQVTEGPFIECLGRNTSLRKLSISSFQTPQLLEGLVSVGKNLTSLNLSSYRGRLIFSEHSERPLLRMVLEANQGLEEIILSDYNFANNFESTILALKEHPRIKKFDVDYSTDNFLSNFLSEERLKSIAEIFETNYTLIELSIERLNKMQIERNPTNNPLITRIYFALLRNRNAAPSLLSNLFHSLEEQ